MKIPITAICLDYIDYTEYKKGKLYAYVWRNKIRRKYTINFDCGAIKMLYLCRRLASRVIENPQTLPEILYVFEKD